MRPVGPTLVVSLLAPGSGCHRTGGGGSARIDLGCIPEGAAVVVHASR